MIKIMDFYNKILYPKELKFTNHSKNKNMIFTQEQKSYASYEAYKLPRKREPIIQIIITSPTKSNHDYNHHIKTRS